MEAPFAAPEITATIEFTKKLDVFSTDFPEIADIRDELQASGEELVQEFAIAPQLFEDDHKALLFTAVAERYNKLKVSAAQGKLSREQYYKEQTFITNTLLLIAGDSATYYSQLEDRSGDTKRATCEPAILLEAYTKVEDPSLREQLQGEIERTNLFASPRERLGIPHNRAEEAFVIHVLDIDERANPKTEPERYKNTQEFLAKTSLQRLPGRAWVSKIDGTPHMGLPRTIVMQLLSEDDLIAANARALVRHEYVHTQGCLAGEGYYASAEEERANRVSSNTNSYAEERYLFKEIAELSGFDVIEQAVSDYSADKQPTIHRATVRALGLSALLNVALASPRSKAGNNSLSGEITRAMPTTLGLLETVLAHKGITPEVIRARRAAHDAARPRVFTA